MDFSFGKDAVDGHHDADQDLKFIQRIQVVQQAFKNNWRRARQSTKPGMTSIELIINFRLVTEFGYTSPKKE